MGTKLIAMSLCLLPFWVDASPSTQVQTSNYESSLDGDSAIELTDRDRSLAKMWMLKESDWIKVKKIMAGPRGVWSPGLDPLTALGVSETDPKERRRYAEIWMKMEIRRAELELAFEVERQAAGKRILGDQLMVENGEWIQEWEEEQSRITHQVMLFVDETCLEDCEDQFANIYASVGEKSRLDIFFSTQDDSEAIGVWAAHMKIDPKIVSSRKVTLNFKKGYFAKYQIDRSQLPVVKVVDMDTGETTQTFGE